VCFHETWLLLDVLLDSQWFGRLGFRVYDDMVLDYNCAYCVVMDLITLELLGRGAVLGKGQAMD